MNRQGQPQQRPPSLGPNPALANQYRSPYGFALPPSRNVNILQAGGFVPGMQPSNHRTPTQQVPPTPYIPQRAQSTYPFAGGLSQHQPASLQQQQQQQQTNGTSNSLPPHLTQTPNLTSAQSVSSTSEIGLDPNDFPALGSTSTNNNSSNGNTNGNIGATSYASQAGTGVGLGGAGTAGIGGTGAGSTSQPRDFTADDFPALGGQPQSQSASQTTDSHSHPPGLNGFEHSRQHLIGALSGLPQGTPGMLNLGAAQARNVFETDKQQQRNNYSLKLNPPAWNSPNANPGTQSAQTPGLGAFSNPSSTQQNGTHPSSTQHLNAPPGVPPPNSAGSQSAGFVLNGLIPESQQQNNASGTLPNPNSANPVTTTGAIQNPNPTNANVNANTTSNPNHTNPNSTQNPSLPNSTAHVHQHPQTPAQQILMSAADRWGLLGLLAMIKNAGSDIDQGLSSVGTDLGTMGLDMGYGGSLYSTFITPWADQSAAHTVEPDFHLPACYSVQPPPPGPSKAQAFSDETLFFMFYSTPRDALQEVAAQELWNRNWRFHKELRLWITKESGAAPSQKVIGGESGTYTYWDPENWTKERKDMTVLYSDLEEKTQPAFLAGPGLIPTQPVQQSGQQRGSFQVGVTALN